MLPLIPFFLFASAFVTAAPFERRASSIISNCNHDFSYTWDDGPYKNHDEINDIFTSADSHTTFYINGDNWSCIYDEDNVANIRASYEAGHQLAHHGWAHADLKTLTYEQIDVEIGRLNDAFIRILGVKPKVFRPPYGSVTEPIAAYITQKFGLTVVLWSDDSKDSADKISAEWNYQYYKGLAAEGSSSPHLVLSHETIPGSVEALRDGTVTELKAANINVVTTATCLDMAPYETVTGYYGTPDASWTCSGPYVPGVFSPPSPPSSSSPTSVSTTTTSTSSSPTPVSTTAFTDAPSSSSTSSPVCAAMYYPTAVTTCEAVAALYSLQVDQVKSANSFINCADIWAGTPLCIVAGPTATSSGTTSTSSAPTSSPPPCAQTYTAVAGDTCDLIAGKFGLTKGGIANSNAFLNCADIWAWTPVCIPLGGSSSATPTPTSTPSTCVSAYYSVQGDTCDSIAAKYGLQGAQILSANSYLNCGDIWSNSAICIPASGSRNAASVCTKSISSKSGDTCDTIALAYNTSKDQILTWNSFLTCSDIWANTPVCVSHS